jgi:hypothetical protein
VIVLEENVLPSFKGLCDPRVQNYNEAFYLNMSETAPFETLTKLEVAERQLRVAIRLFFERKDVVAVHTLAAASRDLLNDLAKRKGIKSFSTMIEDIVRPEKLKEFREAFRRPQNFFKHADRDAEGQIDFYYEGTKFFILEAVINYGWVTGSHFLEAQMFYAWFLIKNPHTVRDEQFKKLFFAEVPAGLALDDFDAILAAIDLARLKSK